MPLKKWTSKKSFQSNIRELVKDNKKEWKERGAWWKERPMKQIVAIAYAMKKKK